MPVFSKSLCIISWTFLRECKGVENLFFLMMCTLLMFYDLKVQCDRITKLYAKNSNGARNPIWRP